MILKLRKLYKDYYNIPEKDLFFITNIMDINKSVELYLTKLSDANISVLVIQFNKAYKMGTIGKCEGELITYAFEYATRKKIPIIAIISSGGIRINEGTIALMQMAKMIVAIKKHSEKGLLYISVITNPTLGGTSASLVSLADIIIAEKNAIYGFSGKRIIEDTTSEKVPYNFQTAEFAKEHGMVDIVAEKDEILPILAKLLKLHKVRN